MKKSYTLHIIDSQNNYSKRYDKVFNDLFDNLHISTDIYDTFEYYHHYKPDVVVLASNELYSDYEPFLKKVKINHSTPVIILIEAKDVVSISSALNYNFNYAILDENFEKNISDVLSKALTKVKIIEKLLVGYNQKFSILEKNKAVIENSKLPSLITNSKVDQLKCNNAFLDYFDISQEAVNEKLARNNFIDPSELAMILESKDITKEQFLRVNGNAYECQIYILQKYELYLIIFDTHDNENSLIDKTFRKELETILQRIDKNFDDYVKLQYNMIELSTQIKSFLKHEVDRSSIDQWLNSNKKLMDALESQFDDNILEELKIKLYNTQ